MRSTVYVRNFESTLRMLAERGHDVEVVAEIHQELDPTNLIGRLCTESQRIRHSLPPRRAPNGSPALGYELRRAIDYLRYLGPEYRDAPKLRRRAEQKAPAFVLAALDSRVVNSRAGRWGLTHVLRWCDRALPRDPAIDSFIRDRRPDLVIVTPLVEPGSPQSEYLRSARAAGVPTALCVYSWDNLTNKGLIHDPLDLVTVWNAAMKREAVTLHRVPASRVVVTGAAPYDQWFEWTPRSDREAFCARAGLDPSRPYLLYLCSSKFIAPDEPPFVRRWIHDLRAASATLRDVGVLVRPHPQNTDRWLTADLKDFGNVVVWPRDGGNPVDAASKADYYDSIHHSAAVVGINTSAQIESAIVGRGVHTLLAPEFIDTQGGTLHFRHLQHGNGTGGLLYVASSMAEHVTHLEAAVRDPRSAALRCQRFVEEFVRPFGLHEPATPRLVRSLEEVAAGGATARRDRWRSRAARPLLARLAAVVEHAEKTRDRHRPTHGTERKTAGKKSGEPQKAAARAGEAAKNAPHVEPAAPAGEPVSRQAAEPALANYLRVRDSLRKLRGNGLSGDASTPSDTRLRSALAELWDAQPNVIAELRAYGAAIGGARASEYRDAHPRFRTRLERDLLRLLRKGYEALWVEEPAVLGAFGFHNSGKLYNEDTLRFLRVLALLNDSLVLKECRRAATRPTVWEIGGGWGGFAFQLKTLCPDVTYLITGPPELLLLSSVYLMTLFPSASFRIYDPAEPRAFCRDWAAVDFAFAPEDAVGDLDLPAPVCSIDMMRLQQMPPARVERHVQRAYELGSAYFAAVYAAADGEDTAIRAILDRFYWSHPVTEPGYLHARLAVSEDKESWNYFLGWRRLRA